MNCNEKNAMFTPSKWPKRGWKPNNQSLDKKRHDHHENRENMLGNHESGVEILYMPETFRNRMLRDYRSNLMSFRNVRNVDNQRYNWYKLVLCIFAHKRMKWNHVWNHDWRVSWFHHSFYDSFTACYLEKNDQNPTTLFLHILVNWSQTSSIHSATCAPVTAKSGTRSRSINAFWLPAARNLAKKSKNKTSRKSLLLTYTMLKKWQKHFIKIQTGMSVVLKACDEIWEPKHAQKTMYSRPRINLYISKFPSWSEKKRTKVSLPSNSPIEVQTEVAIELPLTEPIGHGHCGHGTWRGPVS